MSGLSALLTLKAETRRVCFSDPIDDRRMTDLGAQSRHQSKPIQTPASRRKQGVPEAMLRGRLLRAEALSVTF